MEYTTLLGAEEVRKASSEFGSHTDRFGQMVAELGHWVDRMATAVREARESQETVLADEFSPHVLMRPHISIDGNKWCALYGENLQDGVAGFGDSPAEAMAAFDKAWNESLPSKGDKEATE